MGDKAAHRSDREFRPIAVEIAERLRPLGLIDADRVLDDVRRIVWMLTFSGGGGAAVRAFVNPPPLALAIAGRLRQVTPMELEGIILEVRLCLWMGAFAALPYTTFGKQFLAHVERQDQPADPAKLN